MLFKAEIHSEIVYTDFGEQKLQHIGVFFDDFAYGAALAVTQLRVVHQQDRLVSALRSLHFRGHFSGVQGSYARVAVAG
jgi:hypothetical protein